MEQPDDNLAYHLSQMAGQVERAKRLKRRFRGALLGALLGDCFGAPFEGKLVNASEVLDRIQSLSTKTTNDQKPLAFTDDTALTMATCRSLIQNNGLEPKQLAREYSETYFKEPRRGYGGAVVQVFAKLRDTNYADPYGPAKSLFGGSGSFGNGAAMRCSGIALFCHKKNLGDDQADELTRNCSSLTHTHHFGIDGARLLVHAMRYVLNLDENSLDENEFLEHLIKSLNEQNKEPVFTSKLKCIREVIERTAISGIDISQADIVAKLGNDVASQSSVPLAIYSFLRGLSKFHDTYHVDNEFFRTLHWAISCGGDTDTIASMACALSGAYLGMDKIPVALANRCESREDIIKLADAMFSLNQ